MSYYTLYDVVESIKDDMNRIDFYIQNCPHHWGSDCLDKNTFLYNLMKRMEWKCNLFDRYTMEKMDM